MDEAKLHEFMGKLVTDMGGAAMIANVILGEELGLYRAMADSVPITPEALATKTGCNARLIREWLSAQAAAGYMEHVEGQFRLPPEQALALAVEDSPVYRRWWRRGVGEPLPRQGQAGRRHAQQWRPGVGRAPSVDVWRAPSASSGPATARIWWPEWLPALEGVVPKLEAGATVADVGCGHGASTVIMAQAYPGVTLCWL